MRGFHCDANRSKDYLLKSSSVCTKVILKIKTKDNIVIGGYVNILYNTYYEIDHIVQKKKTISRLQDKLCDLRACVE